MMQVYKDIFKYQFYNGNMITHEQYHNFIHFKLGTFQQRKLYISSMYYSGRNKLPGDIVLYALLQKYSTEYKRYFSEHITLHIEELGTIYELISEGEYGKSIPIIKIK